MYNFNEEISTNNKILEKNREIVNKNLDIIDGNKNKLLEIESGLNENESQLQSLSDEEATKDKLKKIYENISIYRKKLQEVSLRFYIDK